MHIIINNYMLLCLYIHMMANVFKKTGYTGIHAIHASFDTALILESGCLRIRAEDREISVGLGSDATFEILSSAQ